MKVGAEPKKVAILAVLLIAAAFLYWQNSQPEVPEEANRQAKSATTPAPAISPAAPRPAGPATAGNTAVRSLAERPEPVRSSSSNRGRNLQEFKPSLRPKPNEQRPDPMSIDPTLRLDLLAKLQTVRLQGGNRNLFQFGTPPPPKALEPKIIPNPKPGSLEAEAAKASTAPHGEAVKPPPPPIPLKYYGYALPVRQGIRRAFFLDGEDIVVAGEGELIKKRFRVVRIGISSAVVEDTEFSNQQTLRIVDPNVEG